jgi:hypothetical protein
MPKVKVSLCGIYFKMIEFINPAQAGLAFMMGIRLLSNSDADQGIDSMVSC